MFFGFNYKKYFLFMANAFGRVVIRIDVVFLVKLLLCVKEDVVDDLMNIMFLLCGVLIVVVVGLFWIILCGSYDVSFEYNVSFGAGKLEYFLVILSVGVLEVVVLLYVDVVV